MTQMIRRSHWMTALMMFGLASFSLAQEMPAARSMPSGRGVNGFLTTLDRRVGLSPEQHDAVRGLLADQRQKSQTLRQETDGKIRELLNADQQKKFDALKAEQKSRNPRKK